MATALTLEVAPDDLEHDTRLEAKLRAIEVPGKATDGVASPGENKLLIRREDAAVIVIKVSVAAISGVLDSSHDKTTVEDGATVKAEGLGHPANGYTVDTLTRVKSRGPKNVNGDLSPK